MNGHLAHNVPATEEISAVVDQIVKMVHPLRIYLYNQRMSAAGATTGFKLCVVGEFADKGSTERSIYLEIDSEVPFDVLLYTPLEWDDLCARSESFARRIANTGMVVYG